MIINKTLSYTIKEATNITDVNGRTLTRLAVSLDKEKIDGRYYLEGFELTDYLDKKKVNYTNHKDVLKESEHLKTEIDKCQTVGKLLTIELKEATNEATILKNENTRLKTQKDIELESLRIENEELKKELKKKIPHQEKLKKAIHLITLEAIEKGVTHKVFTEEEYQDLIGTISSVEFQTEQVQYLRTRVEKQDVILQQIVQQTTQRNYIEAKGLNRDEN